MAVSYNKLRKLLTDRKLSAADIRKSAEIAPNTMTKLRRDEPIDGFHAIRYYTGTSLTR